MRLPVVFTPRLVAALLVITGMFCGGVGMIVGAVIRDRVQQFHSLGPVATAAPSASPVAAVPDEPTPTPEWTGSRNRPSARATTPTPAVTVQPAAAATVSAPPTTSPMASPSPSPSPSSPPSSPTSSPTSSPAQSPTPTTSPSS